MIKAIIFDFDGTIIDTETAWYEALRIAYEEHGVELSLELYSQCIGTDLSSFDPYEYLVTEKKLPIDLDQFKEHIRQQHSAFMEKEQMRDGVLDWLQKAKASGLKLGLATSSHRPWIDRHAEQLGIGDYFECIRTADNVAKVKPNPELYLQVLEGLGVAPEEAIAIEDSPNGARAAAAAGIKCIVVPNGVTRSLTFDDSELYYLAESLAKIDFDAMINGTLRLAHSG